MMQPDLPGFDAQISPDTPIIQTNRASSEFRSKSPDQQKLINEALYILAEFGIPFRGLTARKLERMAMAFLAVADVMSPQDWANAKDVHDGRSLKTRDIIVVINENFGENISSGSYDDIRRKDLKLCTSAKVIVQTRPDAAPNDPERGYALDGECADIVRAFGTSEWERKIADYQKSRELLSERLSSERAIETIPIKLPPGTLEFSWGEHNKLQKAIVEKLLPRYGYGAEVLYIGDATHRTIYYNKEQMQRLRLPDLEHREMPDVMAYLEERNWLYVIEAVHASGAIDSLRHLRLKEITADCSAGVVFVTAFLDRATFRAFAAQIAWETEVWIAEEPDHLIHYDGEKFLEPYP